MSVSNDDEMDRDRRLKLFARHSKAAVVGTHLPTLQELFRLMPFCGNNINIDVQTFSERLLPRIKGDGKWAQEARRCLSEMTVSVDTELFINASIAFDNLRGENPRHRHLWYEASDRCLFYAACFGHVDSMAQVAGKIVQLAEHLDTPPEVSYEYTLLGLGWVLIASECRNSVFYTRRNIRQDAFERGGLLIDRACKELDRLASAKKEPCANQSDANVTPGTGDNTHTGPTAMVLERLGNSDIGDGKKLEKEFKEVKGVALPLVELPDLDVIARTLEGEFPHAVAVTQTILSELAEKRFVTMRPTVLYGPPGCGKSTFAERILDLLEVPNESYPCGGVSDSTLGGTARRWHTGEPSLPVAMIRRHALASPGIILDELEKASLNRHNGSIYDALLGLFEPQSAKKWLDPYIQAPVDVSHVVWICTANTLKGIPIALLDRCRIIHFPEPRMSDMPIIAKQMLRTLVQQRGMNPAWAAPFSANELEAMARLWQNRSLRLLQRLVEAVFCAREKVMSRQ